jgi:DNA-binding CsgD family transcriptional regulator
MRLGSKRYLKERVHNHAEPTAREREELSEIARGRSNALIAESRFLSDANGFKAANAGT